MKVDAESMKRLLRLQNYIGQVRAELGSAPVRFPEGFEEAVEKADDEMRKVIDYAKTGIGPDVSPAIVVVVVELLGRALDPALEPFEHPWK